MHSFFLFNPECSASLTHAVSYHLVKPITAIYYLQHSLIHQLSTCVLTFRNSILMERNGALLTVGVLNLVYLSLREEGQ